MTFLFTDIEGSTRRWERDKVAMQAAVRAHDRLMRAAIAAHSGVVFKTIGDAFCAAFPSAERAAGAALDAQRALSAHDFADVDGVRVRMALHTGTADERDGDYFGPTLNRVARILAIGNGAQVLLSATTAELVTATAYGATAVDLGLHRLKDFAKPEHVFQLIPDDVGADSRPLRSGRAAATNLPAETSSFVGRSEDLGHVVRALEKHRIVTIAGTGGIGKTRLELQAARWLADAWDDGVWFASLAPVSSAGAVAQCVADAVGISIDAGGDTTAQIINALGGKRTLLVLDNCEHVLSGVVEVMSAILRGCPNVAILASSRQPLGVSGEVVVRIASMQPADAAALFAERARESDARFVAGPELESVVQDVCRRLDGIPLAIELAAARIRLLGPRALRDRLEHRLRTLVGGARDHDARQQTLRATIDWSYDLLSPQEQRTFRTLGAFADGFSPAGVAFVAGDEFADEERAFEVLCALESQSLVVVDTRSEATRFRLLASLREYAAERLRASDEWNVAADRHLEFLRNVAVDAEVAFMRSGSDSEFTTRLADEVEEMRAALVWSLNGGNVSLGAELLSAIARPSSRLGIGFAGTASVEEFISRTPPEDFRLLARLWTQAAFAAGNTLRTNQAIAAGEQAVRSARASGDDATLAWSLAYFALVAARARRFDEANAALAEARSRAAATDASLGQHLTELEVSAFVAQLSGRLDEAAAAYEHQLTLLREIGDEFGAVNRVMSLAETEHARGNSSRAVELAQSILPMATHLGIEHHAGLLSNLAGYLLEQNEATRASAACAQAIGLLAGRDDESPWMAAVLEHAALAAALGGNLDAASSLSDYCDATFARLGFEREAAERTTHARLTSVLGGQARAGGAPLSAVDAVALALATIRPS